MENNTITIEDLNIACGIIEVAVSRGAFKASELAGVGSLYDKLTQFIEAVSKQVQEQHQNQELPPAEIETKGEA
jgi:hypothetical protein